MSTKADATSISKSEFNLRAAASAAAWLLLSWSMETLVEASIENADDNEDDEEDSDKSSEPPVASE